MVNAKIYLEERAKFTAGGGEPKAMVLIPYPDYDGFTTHKKIPKSGVSSGNAETTYHHNKIAIKGQWEPMALSGEPGMQLRIGGARDTTSPDLPYPAAKKANITEFVAAITLGADAQNGNQQAINFCEAIKAMDDDWRARMTDHVAAGQVTGSNNKITSPMQSAFSTRTKVTDESGKRRAGEKFDAPLYRLTFRFNDLNAPPPAEGKKPMPMTKVYQFENPEIDNTTNTVRWREAAFPDGTPVNASNFDKYLTNKSIIWGIEVSWSTVQSGQGISNKPFVSSVVIQHVPAAPVLRRGEGMTGVDEEFLNMLQGAANKTKVDSPTTDSTSAPTPAVDATALAPAPAPAPATIAAAPALPGMSIEQMQALTGSVIAPVATPAVPQ